MSMQSEPADPALLREAGASNHSAKQEQTAALPRCPEGKDERDTTASNAVSVVETLADETTYVLNERLGVAAELDMDVAPGTPAWQAACDEARRSSHNQDRGDQ